MSSLPQLADKRIAELQELSRSAGAYQLTGDPSLYWNHTQE